MNIQELTRKSVEASQLLSMLSNSHRLLILCELHTGERSVSALEQIVDLSQSALSQHLAKLRSAGIVATRRDAQTIYYSIADERASRILGVLYEMYCVPEIGSSGSKRKKK
jgi:DNA-binding transcriptional ArsR family regulator